MFLEKTLQRKTMIFVEFFTIYHPDIDPVRRKENLKNIRRYLQYLTISNSGLLAYQKSNPFT